MGSDPVRRRLIVHGNVQGVFFRDSTREMAERHGVAGWARNRGDGAVEVVLEGPAESVQEVEAFCREGPDRADVHRIEADDEPVEGLDGFRTR